MWSQFLVEHLKKQGSESVWVQSFAYYNGDLSSVDTKTDWRFKEVKKARKQAKFIQLLEDDKIPWKKAM